MSHWPKGFLSGKRLKLSVRASTGHRGLGLDDPGFAASVLSACRSRRIAGQAETQLFERLLSLWQEQQVLKACGNQRTDAMHVLAAVVMRTRLACGGETIRHALTVRATVAPDWLEKWVPSTWFERSARRLEEDRLPTKHAECDAWAEHRGADGRQLLDMIDAETRWVWLREVPAVQILRRVGIQPCSASVPAEPGRRRVVDDLPPAPPVMLLPR